MEEYLQNMRNLRSQMNDIEEETAKQAVEEQKQLTAIETVEKDLAKVRSDTKCLDEVADMLQRGRGAVCVQITEKLSQVSVLDTESTTLSQTLELLKQERASISRRLEEKRSYYAGILKEFKFKLQEQQEWLTSYKQNTTTISASGTSEATDWTKGKKDLSVEENADNMKQQADNSSVKFEELNSHLEAKKAKIEALVTEKSQIGKEIIKSEQLLEQLMKRIQGVLPELRELDLQALEEEHKAVLGDKSGEIEYQESLKNQIKHLKEISNVIKCQCGQEYKVALNG